MKKLFILIFFLTAYSSAYSQTGFRIKLIKNLNPRPFAGSDSYSALWGYTAPNGREYAILGCFSGTSFIDITDTNNTREVDFLPIPFGVVGSIWREMKTYSHYAYIVSESFGSKIQIVDLQYLPDSIRYVGLSNVPNHTRTHSISQSGHYLYLNGCNPELTQGIAILDLSLNPESPVLVAMWNDLYVHDSRIINDTIWACNIGDEKVSIIDATDKDSLRNIRNWVHDPPPNNPHNIAITDNGNYALVTDEVYEPANPGKLKIWDVSDFDNITYVTSFNPYQFENAVVHNVEIYQSFAFLAYYAAGVKVLNISNPATPVETGWFDTYPEGNIGFDGCWGIYYFPTSGKIIASDRKRGLFVLRPNLNPQVQGIPKADFTVAQTVIIRTGEQSFIDMTEGFPASWQWTISGPETQTSALQNPHLTFNTFGEYNVKLKTTNSFGTDSITRLNYFKVSAAPLQNFMTTSPSGFLRIETSPTDTGKILFSWRKSVNSTDIFYKIYFKKFLGTTEEYILSGNNGRDTSQYLTISFLDSMSLRLGLEGDSVRVTYRVKAYNGTDSLLSTNSVTIFLRRNTTGISSVNETIPIKYFLYNNYPNPFNPSTNILFDIPKPGNVKLTLYDITGREVSRLYDEDLIPGSYKYSFNMGNLNSGVYFVKINANTFTSAIKIVLIK